MLAETEDAGLRDRRHELIAAAHGRTLELGAGTGLNLDPLSRGRHRAHPDRAVRADGPPAPRAGRRLGPREAEVVVAGSRAAALRRRLVRHGRLDARPLHRRRRAGDPRRDRSRSPPRRAAAVLRARPQRRALSRPLAGPARAALALRRPRLPAQPRHRRGDRRLPARGSNGSSTEPCGSRRRSSARWRPARRSPRARRRAGLQRIARPERNGSRPPTNRRRGTCPISSC